MSADNGIYIGRFLLTTRFDGYNVHEYRVIHAQAIENCDYDERWAKELTDAYRVSYYGRADICYTEEEAWQQAQALYKGIMEDEEGMGILEYGICCLNYDVPFPSMTVEQAEKILDDDFKQNEYVPVPGPDPVVMNETDRVELMDSAMKLMGVALEIAVRADRADQTELEKLYQNLDNATLRIAKAFKI